MLSAPTIAISPSLFTKLNYDALRDLAPVTLVAAKEAGVDTSSFRSGTASSRRRARRAESSIASISNSTRRSPPPIGRSV
ncbi:MAG: hypothetical protein ACXWVP_08245 [Burkholderiales bacterium]